MTSATSPSTIIVPVKTRSREILFFVAVLAVAAAAGFATLFLAIKERSERVSELINRIELAAKQEQMFFALQALAEDTVVPRDQLASYFIPHGGTVAFLEDLEARGRATNVHVEVDSVEEVAPVNGAVTDEIRLALHVSGSYADTVRYLGLLELLPIESRVERAAFSQADDGWRLDVTFHTLRLR